MDECFVKMASRSQTISVATFSNMMLLVLSELRNSVAEVTAFSERVELIGNPQQLTAFLKHLCV